MVTALVSVGVKVVMGSGECGSGYVGGNGSVVCGRNCGLVGEGVRVVLVGSSECGSGCVGGNGSVVCGRDCGVVGEGGEGCFGGECGVCVFVCGGERRGVLRGCEALWNGESSDDVWWCFEEWCSVVVKVKLWWCYKVFVVDGGSAVEVFVLTVVWWWWLLCSLENVEGEENGKQGLLINLRAHMRSLYLHT